MKPSDFAGAPVSPVRAPLDPVCVRSGSAPLDPASVSVQGYSRETSQASDTPSSMPMLRGLAFNVQNYSVHDGPGIRVEFFMKGCPLRCEWCSNPEGISPYPEPGSYPDKCMGATECGRCLAACKQKALLFTPEGTLGAIDRDVCIRCLACTRACLTGALSAWGQYYGVGEALDIIRKDRVFFERTGGGVTVSGGEALMQPEFVRALFEQCKAEGINTCLETALYVRPEIVDDFFDCTDLFICDIKCMDDATHRARCGVSNQLILENLRRIAARAARLVVRTPVLKGFNASDAEISAIGRFIRDDLHGRVLQYQLLPYRQLGVEKYASLGQEYPMQDFVGYEREQWEPDIRHFIDLLQSMGINAVSGNNQKLELP